MAGLFTGSPFDHSEYILERAPPPFARRSAPKNRAQMTPGQARLAQALMMAQTHRVIPLDEIAGKLGVSVSHFAKAFANTVGVSPYRWFLSRRVLRAADLLRDTQLTLVEVAAECGFADQSHFTRAFTRVFGVTPARWRAEVLVPAGDRAMRETVS